MSAYSDKILADGAVAYWRLNESSGLTFADAAGTRTATIAAATGLTYGVSGALSDGSTGLAASGTQAAATYSDLVVGTTCTIEFWITPSTAAILYSTVIANSAGFAGVYFNSTVRKINCYSASDNFSATQLTIGVPYHVAVVITAGTGTIYVNGVPDGTVTGWPGRTFNVLFNSASGALAVALLDEVAIYPAALTSTQIAAHYALRTATSMPAWHDIRFRFCRYRRRPYSHPPLTP